MEKKARSVTRSKTNSVTDKRTRGRRRVVIIREFDHLLLAKICDSVLSEPKDADVAEAILQKLRDAFGSPGARWETMTIAKYEKEFPIINRLIAESIELSEADQLVEQFCQS